MTLRDQIGPVEVSIGDRFVCKLSDKEKALMEVVHPYYDNPAKANVLCCRVVRGWLFDDQRKPFGPGCVADFPSARVAAAVRRYREKKSTALAEAVTSGEVEHGPTTKETP